MRILSTICLGIKRQFALREASIIPNSTSGENNYSNKNHYTIIWSIAIENETIYL